MIRGIRANYFDPLSVFSKGFSKRILMTTNIYFTQIRFASLPPINHQHRFTCTELSLDIEDSSLVSVIRSLRANKSCENIRHGIAIASPKPYTTPNSHRSLSWIIPVNEGKIQEHLVAEISTSNTAAEQSANVIHLCSFHERATAVAKRIASDDLGGEQKDGWRTDSGIVDPRNQTTERTLDPERANALHARLQNLSIDWLDLASGGTFEGTAPARIYRSFVYPRSNKEEPRSMERAAQQTATQINIALRQVRADRAEFLRNSDRLFVGAPLSQSSDSSGRPDVPQEAVNGTNVPQNLPSTLHAPKKHPVVLVLDNVRSAFNVGSMFRTSDTAGVTELITCGITCKPPHPKLLKTAMQSVHYVPTRHFDDVVECVKHLKADGYHIVVMETTTKSQHYARVKYPKKTALICGNELTGVCVQVMEMADQIVEIPMHGVKNSLCVSSAVPVVLFAIVDQFIQQNITE